MKIAYRILLACDSTILFAIVFLIKKQVNIIEGCRLLSCIVYIMIVAAFTCGCILLEEDEWFMVNHFSSTKYLPELLKGDFCSTDYPEAYKAKIQEIEYIMEYSEGVYYFQRILKHSIFKSRRITLGDFVKLDSGEKSIIVNNIPDAIYTKDKDILLFRKLSLVEPIFKGIEELYREATEEEIVQFLNNDFIRLGEGYGIDKIKKSNRKRIAMAMETLNGFGKKDRGKILDYTYNYFPFWNMIVIKNIYNKK